MKVVGRRYSRRVEVAAGCTAYDADGWHTLHGAPERYKAWAVQFLEENGIPATDVIQRSIEAGDLNHGADLREYVVSGRADGEIDDSLSLAAQIYELSCLVELFQSQPELFSQNQGYQNLFKLGRLSMLAKVYGIDDAATAGRVENARAANTRYSAEDKARWRALRLSEYSDHTDRNAARLIANLEGLPKSAIETVRKAISGAAN